MAWLFVLVRVFCGCLVWLIVCVLGWLCDDVGVVVCGWVCGGG